MASWLQNASSLAHICIAHHTYISTHACTDKWTTPKQCLQPHLYDEWRHENKRQPYRWIKWVTYSAMYEKQRLTSSWYHFLQNFSTGSTRLSDWTFMLHQGTVTTGRNMSLAETVSPRRRHSTKWFKAPLNCIWTQQLKIYTINVLDRWKFTERALRKPMEAFLGKSVKTTYFTQFGCAESDRTGCSSVRRHLDLQNGWKTRWPPSSWCEVKNSSILSINYIWSMFLFRRQVKNHKHYN